jgi:hydrogenase nickel incorporation protein HypA/HybF
MHELSIALNLVDTADRAARDAGATRVTVVRLRLGALSGVVADALHFSFDVVAAGTLLEGAELHIEELPAVVHCPQCDADVELPGVQQFRCPVCATPTGDVVQGHELELASIEIETEEEADRVGEPAHS